MSALIPEQAQEYSRRWQQAHHQETRELRQASLDLKLRQLASLMASREYFPADTQREQAVAAIRERWLKLRHSCAGV